MSEVIEMLNSINLNSYNTIDLAALFVAAIYTDYAIGIDRYNTTPITKLELSKHKTSNHISTNIKLENNDRIRLVKYKDKSISLYFTIGEYTFGMDVQLNRRTLDDVLAPLIVFKQKYNKIIVFLTLINKYIESKYKKRDVSLLELMKLSRYIDLFNDDFSIEKPSKDAIEQVLTQIKLFETANTLAKSGVSNKRQAIRETRKASSIAPFSISINAKEQIQLKIGSIPVYTENDCEKFKYISHPGLEIFTYLMEKTNTLEKFSTLAASRAITAF